MNITERINQIERALQIMQYADFLDWNTYYNLKDELAELQRQVKTEG